MFQNVMLTCYSGPMTFNLLTQLRLKENVLFYPKVKLRRNIHSFGPIKVKRSKCAHNKFFIFNFFFIQILLLGSFRFYYQSAYNTVTDEVEESLPEEGLNDDQLIYHK